MARRLPSGPPGVNEATAVASFARGATGRNSAQHGATFPGRRRPQNEATGSGSARGGETRVGFGPYDPLRYP